MPLQNRVTPFGDLVAHPGKAATLTGNRGIIHDPTTKTLTRRWSSKAWIACTCDYKGRRRDVWATRSWTELFSSTKPRRWPPATAPASPAAAPPPSPSSKAWALGNRIAAPSAPEMDAALHAERLDGKLKRLHPIPALLPDGAIVAAGEAAYLVTHGETFRWSFDGYERAALPSRLDGLLTPPSTLAVSAAGYRAALHPSVQTERPPHPASPTFSHGGEKAMAAASRGPLPSVGEGARRAGEGGDQSPPLTRSERPRSQRPLPLVAEGRIRVGHNRGAPTPQHPPRPRDHRRIDHAAVDDERTLRSSAASTRSAQAISSALGAEGRVEHRHRRRMDAGRAVEAMLARLARRRRDRRRDPHSRRPSAAARTTACPRPSPRSAPSSFGNRSTSGVGVAPSSVARSSLPTKSPITPGCFAQSRAHRAPHPGSRASRSPAARTRSSASRGRAFASTTPPAARPWPPRHPRAAARRVDPHEHLRAVLPDGLRRFRQPVRARSLSASGTASSRSRMIASAPRSCALAMNRSECAGT